MGSKPRFQYEFPKRLPNGATPEACVTLFQLSCQRAANDALRKNADGDCSNLAIHGPSFPAKGCEDAEEAFAVFSRTVKDICGQTP
ncbi:hypothetical protein BSKO_01499 [Bryopsis sp. KO-2023]|nr:hypothetical protein BSKO_01484 [Bryopsis sp. KO-2023]GMH33665.1 hypothetical protein BSKO_01499 [Bryopsis sp. KO-2023]